MLSARPGMRVSFTDSARYPLLHRCGTSDLAVFSQIFTEKEYACLDDVKEVELVVDCGANVGYSAAYFLSHFPDSRVICIEPDKANSTMLAKNLSPYGSRAKIIRSAIWSHRTGLVFHELPYRDGKEWAVQVREAQPSEATTINATDIGTILKESGHFQIDILKIDIEGAEAMVFASNYEEWLSHTRNIVIEIHDDSFFGPCTPLVLGVLRARRNFTETHSGELSVFKTPTS
jgi:FkbM family methyltransferase